MGLGRWFREWVFGKGLGSVRLLGKGSGSVGLGRRFRECGYWEKNKGVGGCWEKV